MRMRILAVGNRMPSWVSEATTEYCRRLPRDLPLELVEIAPGQRAGRGPSTRALEQESKRLRAKLDERDHVVALEVDGRSHDTESLARWLQERRADGRGLAFLIGGPDGLSATLGDVVNERVSLSKLTLPHGIARVLLAEQLYRAWSLSVGHPYHRAGTPGR
jgi:23S rRNA (pseudouridine1915-N3)-methyltransferase